MVKITDVSEALAASIIRAISMWRGKLVVRYGNQSDKD
jgi:hypothetical protein